MSRSIQRLALDALFERDPDAKLGKVTALDSSCRKNGIEGPWELVAPISDPGRPEHPVLVDPRQVPKRRLGSSRGRAALVHAIAHIEFNAINLALDAIARFSTMPDDYYRDWVSVAVDEAKHFALLSARLDQLGTFYGAMPAHNGLWEMAVKTAHDPMVRMALVPRVLEARGLDVTPAMIMRLDDAGDTLTVEILEVILDEEVRHVAIGTRWFRFLCERRDLCPESTFSELMRHHYEGRLKGPFNYPARRRAGFTEPDMKLLEELA